MNKLDTENELTLKVVNNNEHELVNEKCCTVLTVSLNNNGEVFTSFLGAYNKEVLKLLKKAQLTYYKGLMKKLKNNTVPTMDSNIAQLELNKQPSEKQKTKKKNTKTVNKDTTTIEDSNKNNNTNENNNNNKF